MIEFDRVSYKICPSLDRYWNGATGEFRNREWSSNPWKRRRSSGGSLHVRRSLVLRGWEEGPELLALEEKVPAVWLDHWNGHDSSSQTLTKTPNMNNLLISYSNFIPVRPTRRHLNKWKKALKAGLFTLLKQRGSAQSNMCMAVSCNCPL